MKPLSILASLAILTVTAACSDSDDWTPGPQDSPEAVAFFPEQTAYVYTITPGDNTTVEVTIARATSTGDVTVALTGTCDVAGISIPSQVTFLDGEAITSFALDCSSIPLRSRANVSIAIDNPSTYGAGSANLDLTIISTAGWVKVATVYCTFQAYYKPITSDLMVLDGTNNFKLVNYLNSGIDLPFTLTSTKSQAINPTGNAYFYPEDDYGSWCLYDETNDTYPIWSPDGDSEPKIWESYTYGLSYTYISLEGGYGQIAMAPDYDDGSWGYNDVYLSFTMEYNPFE